MEKITVAEFAIRTGKSKQSIYKRIRRGTLKAVEEAVNGKMTTFILLGEGADNPAEIDKVELNLDNQPTNNPQRVEDNPIDSHTAVEDNPTNQSQLNPSKVEDNPSFNPSATTDRLIEILQQQLTEKDRQIERLQEETKEKDRQIKEQFDRLSTLLLRSQELEAITHKLLGQGGEEDITQTETAEAEDNSNTSTDEITADNEPPKKKSWISRLFYKG